MVQNILKCHFGLGNSYAMQGNLVSAAQSFGRAIEIQPGHPDTYHALSQVYLALKASPLKDSQGSGTPKLKKSRRASRAGNASFSLSFQALWTPKPQKSCALRAPETFIFLRFPSFSGESRAIVWCVVSAGELRPGSGRARALNLPP